MIKEVKPFSVSEIFSKDKKFFYDIPKYQRGYIWCKKECDTLFNDIIDNTEGYFLGSIICINNSKSTISDIRFQVVDGQQRITTLSILILVIYNKINERKEELEDYEKKRT